MIKIKYYPEIDLFQVYTDHEFLGFRNLQWLKDVDKRYYNSTSNFAVAMENPNQEFIL